MTKIVYFIQDTTRGKGGPIKIGFSANWADRVRHFKRQFGESFLLLGICPGDLNDEAYLHETFKNDCIGKEWFNTSPLLVELIEFLSVDERDIESYPKESADWRDRADVVQAQFNLKHITRFIPWSVPWKGRVEFAANYCGLSFARTRSIWYREARNIKAWEFQAIRCAAEDNAPNQIQNMPSGLGDALNEGSK